MPRHPNDVADTGHHPPWRRLHAMSSKRRCRHWSPPPITPSTCHVTQTTSPTPSTTPHDTACTMSPTRHHTPIHHAWQHHLCAMLPKQPCWCCLPPPTTPSACHVTKMTLWMPSTTPTTFSACYIIETTLRTPSTTPHDAVCMPHHRNDTTNTVHHPPWCFLCAPSPQWCCQCCPPPHNVFCVSHYWNDTANTIHHPYNVFCTPRHPTNIVNAIHHHPWHCPYAMSPKWCCGHHPLLLPFLTKWSYIPGKYPLL